MSTQYKESIRGKRMARMVDIMCHHTRLGHKIQTGELRKNMHERPWKVPAGYVLKTVQLPQFSVELFVPEGTYRQRMLRRAKASDKEQFSTGNPALKKEFPLVILHLHGGGYVGRMTNMYRSFAGLYSELGGGVMVLSPDYRVAPAHPYPAALKDAIAAYDWLLAHGWKEEEIVVAGESAGGGLSLALCHYLKRKKRRLPAGLILMSPWTDLSLSGESYTTNFQKDAVFGRTKNSMVFSKEYLDGKDATHPYISPLYGDFSGFPPMLIQVGGDEMLFCDAQRVAKKAKKAGVKVRFRVYEGMFHLFQLSMLLLPESKQAWKEVGLFLRRFYD